MKSTDLRAKARSIFGPADAEPMPNQPNGAKALQQRANARPIPTYKVGGVVKKADGGKAPLRLTPAEKKMGDALMMKRKGKEVMDAQKRMESDKDMMRRKKQEAADKLLGIRMKNGGKACGAMKKGGKVAGYKDGSGYRRGFEPRAGESDAERLKRETEFLKAKAAADGAKSRQQRAEDEKIGFNYQKPVAPKEGYRRGFEPRAGESDAERLKRELEFLKAKAARKKDGGKVQTSADTAKKLATEMGGMKKGGKAKDGLAVMIAIGKVKKPVKKAVGGAGKTRKGMAPIKKAQGGVATYQGGGKANQKKITPEEGEATRQRLLKLYGATGAAKKAAQEAKDARDGGFNSVAEYRRWLETAAYNTGVARGEIKDKAHGGVMKKAQGGAAKVRKGMMSPTGDIKQVVKPKKGLGGM